MALTPERKAQLDALIARQKAAKAQPVQPPAKEPGFLASVAKDIAAPFLKTGTSVANALETTANLGAAGLSGLFGTKEQTRKLLADAAQSIGKRRSFGVLGTAVPVGYEQETGKVASLGQSAKDIVGTGLEIGSYFVGGEGAKNVAKLGFGGMVKKGAVEGLKAGAYSGAAQMGGAELQSPTSTFGSVLGQTALGGGGGGLFGTAIGAAVPAIGAAVSPLLKFGSRAASNVPAATKAAPEIASRGLEWLKRGVQKIERGVQEKAAEAVLPAAEKSATRTGIGSGIIERIKTASQETRGKMREMIAAAKDAKSLRPTTRPIVVAGQAIADRASFISKSLKETGKALGALKTRLRGVPVDVADIQSAIASDLEEIGFSVGKDGKLVSAVPIESDLSGVVSDIYNFVGKNNTMDASDVDRMRQYLFDPNTAAGVPLRGRAQGFAEKYRELLLDKLSEIDPSYGQLAKQYASKRRALEDFVKLIQYKGSMENITDKALRTGEVAFRVLGNAEDRPRTVIDGIIEMAKSVGYEGLDDPYDLIRFADELEKEFGIGKTRALGGQVQTAVEGALSKFGVVGKTLETVGQLGAPEGLDKLGAMEELIDSLVSGAVPKAEAPKGLMTSPTKKDFIASFGDPMHHGTVAGRTFDQFDPSFAGKGVGQNVYDQGDQIYLTETRGAGQYFADLATSNDAMARDRKFGGVDFNNVGPGSVLDFYLKPGARVLDVAEMPRGGASAQKEAKGILDKARSDGYSAVRFIDRGFETIEGSSQAYDEFQRLGRAPKTTIILDPKAIVSKDGMEKLWNQVQGKGSSVDSIPKGLLGMMAPPKAPAAANDLVSHAESSGSRGAETSKEAILSELKDGLIQGSVPKGNATLEGLGKIAKPVFERKQFPGLSPEFRAKETAAFDKLSANTGDILDAHAALPDSMGGKLINPDDFRPLVHDEAKFGPYVGTQAESVHEPSSAIANHAKDLKIAQIRPGDVAVWTAGGPGNGKGTAIKSVAPDIFKEMAFGYDSVLGNFDKSSKDIQSVVDRGGTDVIPYVWRKVEDAWAEGVIGRAKSKGRTVPLEVYLDGMEKAWVNIQKLHAKFKDNPFVSFKFVNNEAKGEGSAVLGTIDDVIGLDYTNLREKYYDKLKKYTEERYRLGGISKEIRDALIGG